MIFLIVVVTLAVNVDQVGLTNKRSSSSSSDVHGQPTAVMYIYIYIYIYIYNTIYCVLYWSTMLSSVNIVIEDN